MTNELAAVQEVTTVAPRCTKCGKVAIKSEQVRDEEGILISVKYQHEMIPASGYVWNCTQVMDYPSIYDIKGSVKKEMDKRPYAFKSKNLVASNPDLFQREYLGTFVTEEDLQKGGQA